MLDIKELVCARVVNLDNYSRSKCAREVKTTLETQGVDCNRGVMSMLYNALDERARELEKERKVVHLISAKSRTRIVNDGEDYLREVASTSHLTARKFTLIESVRLLGIQLSDKRKAFVKEPTESRVKSYYRVKRVLASAVFELGQSQNPEDKTLAENYVKHIEQEEAHVRTVQVQQ